MKNIYFFKGYAVILGLLLTSLFSFGQTTYYWVGGTSELPIGDGNNWNTQINGTGDSRATPMDSDILVFDGTNVGGGTATTGTVRVTITGNTLSQLIFKNGANVIFSRIGGTTGTITLNGDASDDPDLLVTSGSNLTIDSDLGNGNVNIALTSFATGEVGNGCSIKITNTGTHRITSQKENGIVFKTGSTFYSAGTPASGAYPFGSSSQGVQYGIKFEKGSNLIVTGTKSPMGNSSTFQSCRMEPGSNFILRTSITTGNGSWSNLKIFGNITVENNAIFLADGPFYKIDSLTVQSGSTLTTHSSGNTAVLGNLLVDGNLNAPAGSTNVLVMGGSVPQTISGSGTITVPSFTVANYSNVTLLKTVTVATTCNIVGTLNLGPSGMLAGTANLTSRVNQTPVTFTGNTTAGSFIVTNVTSPTGITGLFIKGSGIAENTNVVGFSSSNSAVNLSKPASETTTGTTFTFASDTATLVFNSADGANVLGTSGTKAFQSGSNYIINAATSSPFGIGTDAASSLNLGSVSINAAVVTNYSTRIGGKLNLGNGGILTIRASDTVRITSASEIGGAPFSQAKYIVSQVSGANAGVLRFDGFITPRLFPIGSATNYLPVTLSPTLESDFAVSVFEGITADGTPVGTAFTSDQKAKVVNSVWTINRVSGTGVAEVKLGWPTGLEGSEFTNYPDASVGIGRYNGSSWEQVIGSGDNANNIAMANFSEFSPFSVGQLGFVLPLQFSEVTATVKQQGVDLSWNLLIDEKGNRFGVERSTDGMKFTEVGSVEGNSSKSYHFLDADNVFSKSFYRIKLTRTNGHMLYSNMIMVNKVAGVEIVVYPNPASETIVVAGLKEQGILSIFNASGQRVMQKVTNANSISIDVSALQGGIYFIELSGKQATRRTFIKK